LAMFLQATGKELLAVSRSAVVVWGIIIGLACCMCTGGKLCQTYGLASIFELLFDLIAVTSYCLSVVSKQVLVSHVSKHGAIMLIAEWPRNLGYAPHVSHVCSAFAVP